MRNFQIVSLLCCCLLSAWCWAEADKLFERYHTEIYQVVVINQRTDTKIAIGSGFRVSADGLLVTNFHVVADYLQQPDSYRLEYLDQANQAGALEVLRVDVINDLALLKQSIHSANYLHLAKRNVEQGEDIYSMGNPHDLGMTVVPGIYNGMVKHSFYQRMLFSGSINPGMSGGPALNKAGEVIGVNVATAGNSLSFLVPLDKLKNLLSQTETLSLDDVKNEINRQLQSNQQTLFQQVLQAEWPSKVFGGAKIIGEMTDFTRCWSDPKSTDDERKYQVLIVDCVSDGQVYLSDDFSTGDLSYSFYWLESDELHPLQFYHLLSKYTGRAVFSNYAGDQDVGEPGCHEDFVNADGNSLGKDATVKAVFCLRPYKNYPDLYDVFYSATGVYLDQRALISNFSVTGVSQSLALAFSKKFMEQIQWP